MKKFMQFNIKLMISMGLVSFVFSNAYAGKLLPSSPLFTQKITVAAVPKIHPLFPLNVNCTNCIQTINKSGAYFANYTSPTDNPDQGDISYIFYTGHYLYIDEPGPVCGYIVKIPFTVDLSGNFILKQDNYPAPLHPESEKGCERHASVNVTIDGDTIHITNQVLL